jgi:hypothetical protein
MCVVFYKSFWCLISVIPKDDKFNIEIVATSSAYIVRQIFYKKFIF